MCVQPAPAFAAPKEMWLGFGADACTPEGFRNHGLKERDQNYFQVVFDVVAAVLFCNEKKTWVAHCS